MKLRKGKSRDQTLQDAIRGSVPHGKLGVARIVLADECKLSPIAGCTTYGLADVVERLDLPRGKDYYAATVRSHETRHATFSKRWSPKVKEACKRSEKMAYAVNIIEDCYVEQKPLPHMDSSALRAYCRDHIATATKDALEIRRHKRFCDKNPLHEANCAEARNGRILVATRALAMFNHYSDYAGSRHCYEAENAIAEAIGSASFEVARRIGSIAKKMERRMMAIRLLASLLEDEEGELPEDPTLPPFIPEGFGKGVGMRIMDLNPKSAWTSHEKKITIVTAPSGPMVRVHRYIAAIVAGDSSGLFARRYRQNPSGTVLIDASGSMHATTENVKRLCSIIPDATVAYYSGDDVKKGVLAIYAEKNKRYDGELPTETLLGGNSVDMEALQWMQKQPEPWTLISDLGFCGSSFGGEEIAHAIVERETALKRLTVIPTFHKAFEVFSARGTTRKVSLPSAAEIRKREEDGLL